MADPAAHSRLLTLVFTDLADSTALKTQRGDGAIASLISRHAAHVKRLAGDCGGRIIDWAGDGCFLTFNTSSSAVLFALRLQQAHADEADLPCVRIGIHMGEVTETATEAGTPHVAGLAVDLASRICGLARPGQVLMSAAVYDSARQRIGVESLGKPILWQAHGTYAVKGFDKDLEIGEAGVQGIAPLTAPTSGDKARLVRRATRRPQSVPLALGAIVAIALIGVAYFAGQSESPPAAGAGPITWLAVLPLENLSGDSEQDYFADGMTEAVTGELSKIRALNIISRTSVMQYKGTIKTAPQIASELGAQGLIYGSVMRDGNRVRIAVQLIDARSDTHLWANTYDGTLDNVFELHSTVALAVANEIRAAVTPDERERIAAAKTVNIAAYELYIEGRHNWSQRSPEGFRQARELFSEAIKIDPNFALGHAGLADTYLVLADYYRAPSAEAFRQSRDEAERALALDPALGEAYATLAYIAIMQNWDWDAAEERYLKAIELSPNYATAHQWYAGYLGNSGRHSEGMEEARLAYQLDPNSPVVASIYVQRLARDGQIQEAVTLGERVALQFPDNWRVLFGLTIAYTAAARHEDALAAADRMVEAEGNKTVAAMFKAVSLGHLGRTEEARRLVEETLSIAETSTLPSFHVARAYAAMNDVDRAIEWITRACDTRDPWAIRLRQYPEFDKLVGDPRFQALLRRMNFPVDQESP